MRLLFKLFIKTVLSLASLATFLAILIFFLVYFEAFGPLPDREQLENIRQMQASEVYSRGGTLLGKYYLIDRTLITFEEISPTVIEALVSVEDKRFHQHRGTDWRGIMRVLFKTIALQDKGSGGGSTITQQLVKNLYPRKDHGMLTLPVSKFREMIVAKRLEEIYSKEEILTLYLNTVPFGGNFFGIETASQRYFSKSARDLEYAEAALLVGMLKATTYYNPLLNPENALTRRNLVLKVLADNGIIDGDEAEKLQKQSLGLNPKKFDQHEGPATYFREYLRHDLQDILSEISKVTGKEYNIYTDGLKIHTTLDASMQRLAEQAMQQHMAALQESFDHHWQGRVPWENDPSIVQRALRKTDHYKKLKSAKLSPGAIDKILHEKRNMEVFTWSGEKNLELSPVDSLLHYLRFLNAGLVAMDPHSGEILAWVGGIDHRYFQYDHVNYRTKRQVGSTFKPFIYTTALEQGVSPCKYINAEREVYHDREQDKEWSPGNTDGQYEGRYSLTGALTKSVNTVSVKVLERAGIEKTIKLVKDLGIQSDIPKVPSIALGTPSISLLEMTTAYCAFANGGLAVSPQYLDRILNAEGEVIWERKKKRPNRVISRETAQLMTHMLKSVVNEGTASRLRTRFQLNHAIAGKTGTTQNNADGWFIGIMPRIVVGVWVGADDPGIRFRSTALGQGANTALPIFGLMVQKMDREQDTKKYVKGAFGSLQPSLEKKLDCEFFKEEFKLFEFLFGVFNKEERQARKAARRESREESKAFKREKKGLRLGERIRNLFKKDK